MRRITALSVLVLLAAGCGGTDAPGEEDAAAIEPTPADPTDTAGAVPATLPPDDGDLRDIAATLTEWSVTLSQDSVSGGAIAFNVRNGGSMVHRFEVEGNGQEWESEDLNPGDEVTMSVSLTPGVYQVYCPVVEDGLVHEERGMTTTLRVY
jgi:hypothetical protein